MQTFMDILQVVIFLVEVLCAVALIVLFAYLGTIIHDEVVDRVKLRQAESAKRLRDDDSFFTEMVAHKRRTPPAKHRAGVPREDTAPLFYPPAKFMIGDITLFEQMLEEKNSMVNTPLF